MIVMVDGNNLLHAAADAEPERPPGRTLLCQQLGAWAERYRHDTWIVFDGTAPTTVRAAQIAHPAIDVAYSDARTADAVLIERLAACSAPRRALVVSSDREIVRAARRRRARSMRSSDFWQRLTRDLARPPRASLEPDHKRSGRDDETDWLREFGL